MFVRSAIALNENQSETIANLNVMCKDTKKENNELQKTIKKKAKKIKTCDKNSNFKVEHDEDFFEQPIKGVKKHDHVPKESEEIIGATFIAPFSSTPASPSTTSAQVIITSQLSTNSASPHLPVLHLNYLHVLHQGHLLGHHPVRPALPHHLSYNLSQSLRWEKIVMKILRIHLMT